MKVINSKLAAIGLAAFVFASCSDSNSDGPSSPDITPVNPEGINLVNGSTSDFLSRVANYKNTTANARKFFFSRAGQQAFATAVPEIPAQPSNAKMLNNPADLVAGQTYQVTGNGKVLDMTGKKIAGATIYVHGGATLKYDGAATGSKIYVEKGGVLEYTGNGEMIPAGAEVICDLGTITSTNNIVVAGELYANWRSTKTDAEGNIKKIQTGLGTVEKGTTTPTQNITFKSGAQSYIVGSLRAKELTIEEGASVNATAHIMNATTVNVNGALQFGGFLRTATLNVAGELVASENSAIKATSAMNVENGAKVTADYINVTNKDKNATLTLKGNSEIAINNKSVINVNNLVTDNNAGQITLDDNDAIAVIKADEFHNNGDERINTLATRGTNATFLLQFTKSFNGSTEVGSFEDLDLSASYLDYDKATDGKGVKEKENGADYKTYGYEWVGDPAKIIANPKLDLIAAENPTTDGQSATCIATANGKIYVSYHTNGDNVSSGNVEVAHMDGNKITIDQTCITESFNVDYNQLIIDGNNVWVVGNQKGNKATSVSGVGAFLGKFELASDGTYKTGAAGKLTMYPINKKESGIDANCVTKYGDDLVVATTKGWGVFDKDMNYANYDGAEGKYAVTANNSIYALDLTNNGQLSVWNTTDFTKTPVSATATGAIDPAKGKAVIAVDGNDVYVCKGKNGLTKISNGQATQVFECPEFTDSKDSQVKVKGNCNGVAVDSKYIYIACGSYGLVVLDKATGKEVCHRKAYTGKSANYVSVDANGYIYVAYGQSRIQVFKLAQTK